jgi:hypothetical protein
MHTDEAEDFYVFATSNDHRDELPGNSCTDMTIMFEQQFDFTDAFARGEYWTVALTDIVITSREAVEQSTIIILCDVIQNSYIKGQRSPVLRIITNQTIHKSSLLMPYYHKVARPVFKQLRITLCDLDLVPINSVDSNAILACTLHFQKTSKL